MCTGFIRGEKKACGMHQCAAVCFAFTWLASGFRLFRRALRMGVAMEQRRRNNLACSRGRTRAVTLAVKIEKDKSTAVACKRLEYLRWAMALAGTMVSITHTAPGIQTGCSYLSSYISPVCVHFCLSFYLGRPFLLYLANSPDPYDVNAEKQNPLLFVHSRTTETANRLTATANMTLVLPSHFTYLNGSSRRYLILFSYFCRSIPVWVNPSLSRL
jgi:hypothetical protein